MVRQMSAAKVRKHTAGHPLGRVSGSFGHRAVGPSWTGLGAVHRAVMLLLCGCEWSVATCRCVLRYMLKVYYSPFHQTSLSRSLGFGAYLYVAFRVNVALRVGGQGGFDLD